MIKAFLIRQPPDTPAVLVCTAAVGGLCAADQDLLSVPTPVRPNNRPTRSSSVGVKSSPRELSALSTSSAPHSVSGKGESLFHRPPSFLAVARRGLFWKVAEPSTTPICTQLPVSLCQPTHWVVKAKANLATSKQEPANFFLEKNCQTAPLCT